MREAYKRSQKFIQTIAVKEDEDNKTTFRKQLLGVAGFSTEQVEALDPEMTDEVFQEMVRKRLLGLIAKNGMSQRVINVAEVEHFLSNGWDFVATLPDDRIVVRLPH